MNAPTHPKFHKNVSWWMAFIAAYAACSSANALVINDGPSTLSTATGAAGSLGATGAVGATGAAQAPTAPFPARLCAPLAPWARTKQALELRSVQVAITANI